jgi:AcrR family transcriptional regulator
VTQTRALQPRRKPVQRRSTATVERILQAAAQVFERHGYAAGTTNRIAAQADVSIGTLYQYYPNKDAVLVALVERHLNDAVEMLMPLLAELAAQPPLRQALDRALNAMLELHRHQPKLHRVLFEEAPQPPQIHERLDAIFNAAVDTITNYFATQPQITVPDHRLAAQLTYQIIETTTHTLVIHPRDDYPPDAYTHATATMLESYLTNPTHASNSPRLDTTNPAPPPTPPHHQPSAGPHPAPGHHCSSSISGSVSGRGHGLRLP